MAYKPPAPSRTIVELAAELIISILEQLDGKTLVCCRQVCRFLKELVDESIVLRYKIELAIAGMEDGAPSDISVADRLFRLRKYTTAWADLKWESVERLPLVRGDLWQLYGGVLAVSCGSSSLFFHKLPGHTRGIKGKEWRIEDVGFEIQDYEMDPSQDLLVMFEATERSTVAVNPPCKLHLRTLCTGKPHPLCTNPAIIVPEYFGSNWYSSMILSGDNVGIMISPWPNIAGHEDVIVWNWKNSRIRTWIRGSKDRIRSLAFLTDRHLLLAIVRNNEPRLEVYDMEHTLPTKVDWTGADYLCAFLYPDASRSPDFFEIRSDPCLSWNPANVEAPFFPARNNRAFSVTLNFMLYRFTHFIPSSVLRSRLYAHEKAVFAWEEWGPVETSMMEMPLASRCSTDGSRRVYWDLSGMAGAVEAKLLDFNVMARKPQPHVVRCTNVWKNMQTSLPFICGTVTLPPEVVSEYYIDIMISEDNLIVISGDFWHILTI